MCGIVGIVSTSNVNQMLYDALTVLQHRGQDAAGIVTFQDDRFFLRKDNGLVRDVFHTRHMRRLVGNVGIGHVRYPTAGSASSAEAQPFYVNSPYGITLAHNGNLTNADELSSDLFRTDLRHINTNSDSEVLLNVFAHELQKLGKLNPTKDEIFAAVRAVHQRCRGAYGVIAMITGYGIVGFRDPNGIRPACYGVREADNGQKEYMIASESVALNAAGFTLVRDIEPGEAVYIETDGTLYSEQCAESPKLYPCIFEHVYFARPDSIMDGVSVYKARLRMGEVLADKVLRERPNHDIDVVIPIPDTSRTSAMQMAYQLGVKYREGFIKNRYIGRTFIMPGQKMRKKSVRQKLNPIDLEFRGKNVMLVDDSIVRGTTCKEIVQMARDAGARNVYFASAAPPVRYPNVYGIDMPSASELIAHDRTVEEVGELIGTDWLVYQELDDLVTCVSDVNEAIDGWECSVFSGNYITGDIDKEYLTRLEDRRKDISTANESVSDVDSDSDSDSDSDNDNIDLHNDED
ncbi:amidophosphoribosyltransferase [Marinobacter sp. JH2]|uniref:amidophosphoribosyltransferase n=1 Tax=Marinobacter sp. AL4B TaxID=2871173 RepID=UPI0010550A43|nr:MULTISPECIES: amidophosphoribosyltransferase [unclassified Marinobacter]MBZ0333610.1 amidophosphoribosyltransferase [Marinobacter sp. AL4B]QBM17119.1 amidophosphoribosyltransferase [Marinobacter sp. JH2]